MIETIAATALIAVAVILAAPGTTGEGAPAHSCRWWAAMAAIATAGVAIATYAAAEVAVAGWHIVLAMCVSLATALLAAVAGAWSAGADDDPGTHPVVVVVVSAAAFVLVAATGIMRLAEAGAPLTTLFTFLKELATAP